MAVAPIPFPRDPFQFPTRTAPVGIGPVPDAEPGDQIVSVSEGNDGSIDIVIADAAELQDDQPPSNFDENLAARPELMGALDGVAAELLEGIDADDRSRSEFVNNYIEGLGLLGLTITKPNSGSTETLSSVTHPILLEACLRTRALTRGEILPAAGPVKVRNDGDETPDRQTMADDLETDVNHYLTTVASEYYPDTDRGLIYLAFGGDIFKKVYRCPVRKRPVSECVYLPDLIVSQDATDLRNAVRKTHRIEMNTLQVKRLVDAGAYVDVQMTEPAVNPSAIDRKEKEIQGISPMPQRQQDYQRTILECYTHWDFSGRIAEKDAPADLPLPYRITIDKDSRKVLEIRRNWKEGDTSFSERQRFVKWPFVPGMGFYDMGYLHIIGQHAKALTALLRISIDAGMLANFPGGVKLRGTRTDTNQIRPAPGEWVEVDGGAGVTDIRQVMMGMPYKELSPVLLQLMQGLEDDARKLAGTVELEAGEGRTNVPVGTIMAMIEQQTQMMTAVHKGLHAAQQEEMILLRELFVEDPEALYRENPHATRTWKVEELTDLSLVPASDPNVPAHIHRTMQGYALALLSQGNPLYNQMAVQKRLLETLRIPNPDDLLVQPEPSAGSAGGGLGAAGDPTALAAIGVVQNQARKNQMDAANNAAKLQQQMVKDRMDWQARLADTQRQWNEHVTTLQKDMTDGEKDRQSRERIAAMNGQVQLILKGLEQLGQPTSPDPVNDQAAGP